MLVDLDRFKEVNDTLGHHTGDEVLRHLAGRLSVQLGDRATVARLGGDEFGVLVPAVAGRDAAGEIATRIVTALQQPVEIGGMSLEIDGSIGIALYPDHGTDADVLMQHADVAMYAAKENHQGHVLYSPALDTTSPSRLSLVGDLRRAIQD